MTLWDLGDIYPDESIEFLFTRTINQIKHTSQDIIDVYGFFDLIGEAKGDFSLKNTFNELIKSGYDEWALLKKHIVEALREKRLDNTYQILVRTSLMLILNYSFAWQSMLRMEVEINAEKMGEVATKFYDSVVKGYAEIQGIYMKTKKGE